MRAATGVAALQIDNASRKHEYEFMFTSVRLRVLLLGFAFWLSGTILIRLIGEHLLLPGRVLIVYAISFALMLLLTLRVFRWLHIDPLEGVTLLALPTLVFDALTCVFFASVFPNLAPAAAGLFGGWMLICCGGAVVGAWAGR